MENEMLVFEYNADGAMVQVHDNFDYSREHLLALDEDRHTTVNRNDFNTLTDAQTAAADAVALTGEPFLAVDKGRGVSPRFDVIRTPRVGDKVSYSFNGDTTPCGTIARISPTLKKVTTSEGQEFFRRGESAAWVMNGTWSMVKGHHSERNPSF